jgi:nucleoid DNA-binding protein
MAKKAAPKAAEAKAAPAPTPKAAPASGGDKSARPKAATKGEVYTQIAEKTNLPKKDVAAVFSAMSDLINKELSNKKGPGLFVIPGLLKLKVVRKPATKAKQGINPFTKEPMTIKAKPARNVIKALPLKALKDSV